MKPSPKDPRTWSKEMQYLYHERAAIKEFDGLTPRARAEEEARIEVWRDEMEGDLFR